MDDESGGILNISLSDSETEEQQTPAKPSDRTGQSEEEFQAVKRTYHVRVENGNISEGISIPLGPNPNKMLVQQLIHAVEEHYFFRRYEEGIKLVEKVLGGEDSASLDESIKNQLLLYKSFCHKKLDLIT
uniref:Uncharacterized protein n=1 Tax=Bionectria ochroleuca TaxID=29856 RepID=A0A8H7TTR7_BIOOC